MATRSFDVVIVGSGAAGCVVADHLARHTKASIAIIEAGGRDNDALIRMPGGYSRLLARDRHVWKYETVPQRGSPRRYRMGKVVGGGTSVNAQCYVRGQREDFDGWREAVAGNAGWGYETLLACYREQERNNTFHDAYHGTDGRLSVELPRSINELNLRCLRAFQEYGLPYNADYNGARQIGTSPLQVNVEHGRRCSAASAWLHTHLASGRVTLLADRFVHRVLLDHGRAQGVELGDGRGLQQIPAGQVILCAGSVQSPRILMSSGIGPETHLRGLGIRVRQNAPAVGANLHDHPVILMTAYVKGRLGYQHAASGWGAILTGLQYLISRTGLAAGNGIETVSHWNPRDLTARPTVQCFHTPVISIDGKAPVGGRSGLTFGVILLQPQSRGSVRLANADPRAMPRIDPDFFGRGQDLHGMLDAVRAVREVMRQPSLAGVIDTVVAPSPDLRDDAAVGNFIRSHANTAWHPVGTCRMGADEAAVVDPRLRVQGFERLHVIDASIMPTITSGNTSAPTQALALHGARLLAADCFA